jgi:hypothetical protein
VDPTKAIAIGAVVLAVLIVLSFGIAALVGGNERGNDDHELTEEPDDYRR